MIIDRIHNPLCFLIIFLLLLFVACAKVMSPPGGPPDTTSPTIISTIPLSNGVNTKIDNRIEILYSEKIDKKSIPGAIFISPRVSGDIEYSWKGNQLTINMPDSFLPQTTYIVTIGAAVRDIRGNKLENSYSFAFSTGETINNGKLDGSVFEDAKQVAGATIGIYDYGVTDSLGKLDSLYPPYSTQSGKEGEFAFKFLPNGEYLVLAFMDKNQNQLLDFPEEKFAVPNRFLSISQDSLYPPLHFYLTDEDTTALSIISATTTKDHLLKVRFSKPFSGELLAAGLGQVFLQPTDKSGAPMNPAAIRESSDEQMSTFNFYIPGLTDGRYILMINQQAVGELGSDSSSLKSSEFDVQLQPDQNRPVLEYFSHENKITFPDDSLFEFSFSEPIDTAGVGDSAVMVFDTYDIGQDIAYRWPDNFRVLVSIGNPGWGENYTVVLDERKFPDMSGNILGDSIRTFNFSTYDSDSLGGISGDIVFDTKTDTSAISYLIFRAAGGKDRFRRAVSGKRFSFQLPPGKYLMDGFIDKNGNGKFDTGSLIPFQFSETSAFLQDTIRIRSRFETTGIVFEMK